MCGYFLSPLFSACIMDIFSDKVEGMKWGFWGNEFMSVFAVVFVILMLLVVHSPASEAVQGPGGKPRKSE